MFMSYFQKLSLFLALLLLIATSSFADKARPAEQDLREINARHQINQYATGAHKNQANARAVRRTFDGNQRKEQSADNVYKWVDEKGQTHYSQQAPTDHDIEIIKSPPPPAIDPDIAQKEIDTLIEKQNGIFEKNEKEHQQLADEAAEQKKKEEYCQANKHNLQQLQGNPRKKMVDAKGNLIRLTEEQRQQRMAGISKNIAKHCQ